MSKTPTLAEELFEKIKSQSDPAAFLKAMADPANPTFESDYLDFKARPDPDQNNTNLKKIWYEALSGFGNSGGGILIGGIDARKDQTTGIDVACDVKPIKNPVGFKCILIELQRGATDPPLGDVKIEIWQPSPGEGFVVCLIPSARPLASRFWGRRSRGHGTPSRCSCGHRRKDPLRLNPNSFRGLGAGQVIQQPRL